MTNPHLTINYPAVNMSSMGVRRYYKNVMEHLDWAGEIDIIKSNLGKPAARFRELIRTGSRGSIFWSPCQRGPLNAYNHVITIHDCISAEHIYRNDWRLKPYKILFNRILHNSSAIVAIS